MPVWRLSAVQYRVVGDTLTVNDITFGCELRMTHSHEDEDDDSRVL